MNSSLWNTTISSLILISPGNFSSLDISATTTTTPTSLSVVDALLPILSGSGTCCNQTEELLNDDPYHLWKNHNSSIELSVLRLQGTKKYMLETCLIISAISLVVSFLVYCIVPELRTVPGKCLMGLIVSEFVTDILVICALQFRPHTLACFIIGILVHYFFLTIVCWTSVIAFDIMKKFKYPNQKLRHFVRYIFYVYLIPLVVVSIALSFEFSPRTVRSSFRPHYGQRICAVSAPLAKIFFMTIPINLPLISNLIIFLFAIYKIKRVVNEHSSISTSIKERCKWYAKLSLLMGISSLFGFFGIQLPCCQSFKFASFLINSLHGTFIFIAFTCKQSTFRLLAKHILPCRRMKPSAGLGVDGFKKSTKFTLDDNAADSRESSIRNHSREKYRSLEPGMALATSTTITSSTENTPQRGTPMPLHSLSQPWASCSYPKFDSIVISTVPSQDCNNNSESHDSRKAAPVQITAEAISSTAPENTGPT